MGVTTREVTPAELPGTVADDEATLVPGAPSIGKSLAISQIDWPVRELAEAGSETGPVVVDDFQ